MRTPGTAKEMPTTEYPVTGTPARARANLSDHNMTIPTGRRRGPRPAPQKTPPGHKTSDNIFLACDDGGD